jgi:hypothetical protein
MAEGAIASVQETLGIQSPSKVMRELGQNTAEGFALGVEDGAGQANAAVGGLGGEPTGGSSGAAGGRGGVVFQFGERSIVVEVKADGATPDLLEQIVTRIEEGLRPQILTVFAQMATETGMVGGG